MSANEVTRGDRFRAYNSIKPERWRSRHLLYIEVTRVARDRTWADIRVCNCYVMWTKRQPLPLPADCEPYDWTQADLDRQDAEWMVEQ